MKEPTCGVWKWHSKKHEDGRNDGSVYAEEAPGQAYCVCKAPQYASTEQWEADACLIASAKRLREALEWYVREDDVNEGDPDNAYWVEGRRFAEAVLAESYGSEVWDG